MAVQTSVRKAYKLGRLVALTYILADVSLGEVAVMVVQFVGVIGPLLHDYATLLVTASVIVGGVTVPHTVSSYDTQALTMHGMVAKKHIPLQKCCLFFQSILS